MSSTIITHDAIIKHFFFFLEYKRVFFTTKIFYHIKKYVLNVNTNTEHNYFFYNANAEFYHMNIYYYIINVKLNNKSVF